MPDSYYSLPLPADGGAVVLPPAAPGEFVDRIAIRGFWNCYGDSFDARFLADGVTPHPYLKWSPVTPECVGADVASHTYQYRVAPGSLPDGQSLTVRLDVDRLIDHYIGQTRSEIAAALSGSMQVMVHRTPVTPSFPWWGAVGAGLLGTATLGGLAWVVRRRQLLADIPADLLGRINRIQKQADAARQAIRRQAGALPLRQRIETLADAALPLARQVTDLRKARTGVERPALLRAVAVIEERLPDLAAESVERREADALLAEKRKAVARWDDLERAESLCLLRLEKIEAILEATTLTLHAANAHAAAPASEEALRKSLDAEVAAVHAVARQSPELQLTIAGRG